MVLWFLRMRQRTINHRSTNRAIPLLVNLRWHQNTKPQACCLTNWAAAVVRMADPFWLNPCQAVVEAIWPSPFVAACPPCATSKNKVPPSAVPENAHARTASGTIGLVGEDGHVQMTLNSNAKQRNINVCAWAFFCEDVKPTASKAWVYV